MIKMHRFSHFHISFIHIVITHRNHRYIAYIDDFQLNRTLSIQYIAPFQYKTTSHIQELDLTPPYKDTMIYKNRLSNANDNVQLCLTLENRLYYLIRTYPRYVLIIPYYEIIYLP